MVDDEHKKFVDFMKRKAAKIDTHPKPQSVTENIDVKKLDLIVQRIKSGKNPKEFKKG